MSGDWSHWLFVGLAGAWVLAMIVCGVICWAHSRQVKREEFQQSRHLRVVDDREPYDWNKPYDWQEEELRVPQAWVDQCL